MTEQEQQIEIAEECGQRLFVLHKPIHDPFGYYRKDACGYTSSLSDAWKVTEDVARKHTSGRPHDPDRVIAEPAPLPDYLNDLNAMHEAEKTIISDVAKCLAYQRALLKACDVENYPGEYAFIWHATAAQRAEAFLRTIGKWKEQQ